MLAKQPASLGGFEFDAIIKRSETMTCDVPEYATEEGYSITDNICLKPRELEIEAIITNSPVTWAEQHAASSSRVETMVEELRQLWLKKRLRFCLPRLATATKICASRALPPLERLRTAVVPG